MAISEKEILRRDKKLNSKGWRSIPHPTYGNYGGQGVRRRSLDIFPTPVDAMDKGFLVHDNDLRLANKLYMEGTLDDTQWKKAHKEADQKLGRHLRLPLKPYARRIYGPIYNRGARLIFRP